MLIPTLKRTFGFPTFTTAEPQSASLDCAKISSARAFIYKLLLSEIPAFMQTSGIKEKNTLLGTSVNLKLVFSVFGARTNIFCSTLRTGTSSSKVFLYLSLVLRYNIASPVLWFVTARWAMLNSNSDSLSPHHDSLPAASAMLRTHGATLRSVQIMEPVTSRYRRGCMMASTTARPSLCVAANFCSLSLSVGDQ